MSQEQILKEVKEAIRLRDLKTVKQWVFHSIIPNSETISNILEELVSYSQWTLVEQICLIEGGNKPSQSTIDSVLERVLHNRNFKVFKSIFEQIQHKPSQHVINNALKIACDP